ncbi:MAG: hypothetical protein DME75_05400 [Verrucomicrobia bacterium]|nr:MAG: hypothetical protein DME75_05400 [Verrucomicrobiota bacterium]
MVKTIYECQVSGIAAGSSRCAIPYQVCPEDNQVVLAGLQAVGLHNLQVRVPDFRVIRSSPAAS